MTDTSPPILETRALTMRFGGVVAVDNVDFSLAEGELRCLPQVESPGFQGLRFYFPSTSTQDGQALVFDLIRRGQ